MELTKFTDEDAADLGRALIKAIEAHAYPGWHPAECPSEIVGDLRNECDELRRDAERYRKLRDCDNDISLLEFAVDNCQGATYVRLLRKQKLDAAIDAAMEKS